MSSTTPWLSGVISSNVMAGAWTESRHESASNFRYRQRGQRRLDRGAARRRRRRDAHRSSAARPGRNIDADDRRRADRSRNRSGRARRHRRAISPERRFGRALLVALDTRRGDFFLQLFRDRADEPFLASGDDAPRALPETPILLAGDAAHRLAPYVAGRDIRVADNPDRPLAADVARLAAVAYRDGVATPPRPLYLRAPDTTVPRREAAR